MYGCLLGIRQDKTYLVLHQDERIPSQGPRQLSLTTRQVYKLRNVLDMTRDWPMSNYSKTNT